MPVLKNARHERFAQEVFSGKSATEAYAIAGYRHNRHNASALLNTNQTVRDRVSELAQAAASVKVMTAQQVLEELSCVGRSNMQDYMTVGHDGLPRLDWSGLTREQAAALAEVTVDQVAQMGEDGETLPPVNKVKFKLASKLNALELLGKHHALYIERVEVVDSIAERLKQARARAKQKPHGKSRKV